MVGAAVRSDVKLPKPAPCRIPSHQRPSVPIPGLGSSVEIRGCYRREEVRLGGAAKLHRAQAAADTRRQRQRCVAQHFDAVDAVSISRSSHPANVSHSTSGAYSSRVEPIRTRSPHASHACASRGASGRPSDADGQGPAAGPLDYEIGDQRANQAAADTAEATTGRVDRPYHPIFRTSHDPLHDRAEPRGFSAQDRRRHRTDGGRGDDLRRGHTDKKLPVCV
jgi:hypothetical protein